MKKYTEKELMELQPWEQEDKWVVSAVNFIPEVAETMPNIKEHVKVSDVTLREAEENVKCGFTMEQRLEIGRRLYDLGVNAIDCGYTGNPDHEGSMEALVEKGYVDPSKCNLFLNGKIMDIVAQQDELRKAIDHIHEIGGSGLNAVCFAPIMTQEQADAMASFIDYAANKYDGFTLNTALTASTGGVVMSGKLERPTSSYDWQLPLAKKLAELGSRGIAIADSFGCASTPAFRHVCKEMYKAIDGTGAGLMVHCHNDFGLGVANTAAGVEEGAAWVDGSLCGYGARAGNTPTDEIVVALEALYGVKTDIKLEKLGELTEYMEEITGAYCQAWKPLTGDTLYYENSFLCVPNMEAKRAGKDLFRARVNETVNPKLFGKEHEMKFGYAGLNMGVIDGFLKYNELPQTPEIMGKIFAEGQEIIAQRKASGQDPWLEEDEVTELCKKLAK